MKEFKCKIMDELGIHARPAGLFAKTCKELGETVVTIESMKLQMKLDAPRDGEIAEIAAREGEGFDKDAVLARLAAPAEG